MNNYLRCGVKWLLSLNTACASSTMRSIPTATGEPAAPPLRSNVMASYSYFELFAALELLDHILTSARQAEGESSLTCRLDTQKVQSWLPILHEAVEEAAVKERLSYEENQNRYQKSRVFSNCAPRCTCAALRQILTNIPMQSLKSQEARIAHRQHLRKLSAKAARSSADEVRSCAERQTWFCASALRDYLDEHSSPLNP